MNPHELASQAAFDLIGAPWAQDCRPRSTRTVAVLDSGVQWRHPYLAPCCNPGWDFVDERPDATPDAHSDPGTQMAGVIASFAKRVGMRLRLLPLRIAGVFTSGEGAGFSSSRIARALHSAAEEGADVIVIARSWPHIAGDLSTDDALQLAAITNHVRKLIRELPTERDRIIVQRLYLDEDDKETLCRDLGLSAAHFDRVVFRARQRIKALFEAKGFAFGDFFVFLLGII